MQKKKWMALALALVWTLGLALAYPVSAEEVPDAAPAAPAEGYTLPSDTTVYAASAILVNLAGDPANDTVIYAKDPDTIHAPGSMMRYMVLAYALYRVEQDNLDIDQVTGTYTEKIYHQYVEGTGVVQAGMNYNESWKLRELMAVSFMKSSSDALATLAVTLSGSVYDYVEGMNALAQELGCVNSHFANMTGVDSLSQYTTARDMYRIVRYCQNHPDFEPLAANYQVTVHPTAGGRERTIVSENELLMSSSQYRYSPIVHTRTGKSEHEGRTCASVARDQGYEYLVVVLGCPEESKDGLKSLHYRDTRTLFQWAFQRFEHKTVLGKSELITSVKVDLNWDTDHLNLVPAREVATVVDKNLDLNQIRREKIIFNDTVVAPIEKGDVLGRVELYINVDQKIGEVDLVAGETVTRSELLYFWSKAAALWPVGLAILVGLILLIIGYIILNIVYNHKRRRQRLQQFKRR